MFGVAMKTIGWEITYYVYKDVGTDKRGKRLKKPIKVGFKTFEEADKWIDNNIDDHIVHI